MSAEHGTAPNRFIWVDLADEGCGIREEDLPHIFSPFFTTKNNGTGLGLATCYRIIKEHGGTIRVESIEGKGQHLQGFAGGGGLTMDQGKILITEDEESLRFVLQKALETEGYWVQTAANGATRAPAPDGKPFRRFADGHQTSGRRRLGALKEIKENGIDTAMILMTAQNTMRNAIGAMKNGAFDYITKPFDLDEVLVLVKRAMDSRKLTRDFRELKEEVKKRFEPGVNIIGTSPSMQSVYKTIGQVVDTLATILILGESGTGKELVAKTIHYNSPRWNQPFVAINCAAIPRDLLESELFGHEKGAFTGALDRRLGKFELAEGGTLFLDEVGDIPLELQTKLLRVLQDHEYSRVGGRDVLKADVRILAATNQDLEKSGQRKTLSRGSLFPAQSHPDLSAAAA